MPEYRPFTEPYKHQARALEKGKDRRWYGYLHEPGCGKTKTALDDAAYNFTMGRINAVLVVAPNTVHLNWAIREIPKHIPHVNTCTFVWEGEKANTNASKKAIMAQIGSQTPGILWVFCVNVEAFSHDRVLRTVKEFLKQRKVFWILDESTKIKTPGAKRTRKIQALAPLAVARRILTGTPITQSPLDFYSQIRFLEKSVLGFDTFSAFKHHFAIWGQDWGTGGKYEKIVEYRYLDELAARVETVCDLVRKEDCLDLPPKIYEVRDVRLADNQRKLYNAVKYSMLAEIEISETEKREINVTNVLAKIIRMQQIVGGHMPGSIDAIDGDEKFDQPIPGKNPKIDCLLDILLDLHEKVIIWARFVPEVKLIAKTLRDRYGKDAVCEYHGEVKNDVRNAAINDFQDENAPMKYFVGTPASGGMGLTLTKGTVQIYFSNDFSLEKRLQAEDRSHRIGSVGERVLYIDLEAVDTIDQIIRASLTQKSDLATMILNTIREGGCI